MRSAEEILNNFPLLKGYKGYGILLACLEMALSLIHI